MRGFSLRSIRELLGMSRADFAAAIGFEGNSNTAHKQIFEMESETKKIMPARALAARALYAAYLATLACAAE
jgi:2-methylcitrate dehydratase PrpD